MASDEGLLHLLDGDLQWPWGRTAHRRAPPEPLASARKTPV